MLVLVELSSKSSSIILVLFRGLARIGLWDIVNGWELLEVEKRLVGERMPCKCRLEVRPLVEVEAVLFVEGSDTELDSRSILLSMIGSMAVIC